MLQYGDEQLKTQFADEVDSYMLFQVTNSIQSLPTGGAISWLTTYVTLNVQGKIVSVLKIFTTDVTKKC